MAPSEELRSELIRVLDQLAGIRPAKGGKHAELLLHAIQLRCMIARADGELIPPSAPGMRCVLGGSPIAGGCPACQALDTAASGAGDDQLRQDHPCVLKP